MKAKLAWNGQEFSWDGSRAEGPGAVKLPPGLAKKLGRSRHESLGEQALRIYAYCGYDAEILEDALEDAESVGCIKQMNPNL